MRIDVEKSDSHVSFYSVKVYLDENSGRYCYYTIEVEHEGDFVHSLKIRGELGEAELPNSMLRAIVALLSSQKFTLE
jgi:hypothetical protein